MNLDDMSFVDVECDVCGRMGAYDYKGDYLCPACAKSELQDAVDDGDFDDR